MKQKMDMPTPVLQQPAPPLPAPYIRSRSRFSPMESKCCQCQQRPSNNRRCSQSSCDHALCYDCSQVDLRGQAVVPHSIPSNWACSSCGNTHSVLDILTSDVACACGSPTLQAVYDQFGKIYLFWRDDPQVFDLSDPAKVEEAAWRIWKAGGEPWEADVLRIEAERAKNGRALSRLSQSSESSGGSGAMELD
ncbi:hypothetical protein QBC47DRAFT_322211 [Echria macrotheca]|uniref:RING-type domain-containing protein n=1 Tax=Echria macrotheca TaxID=438768 RepID=A0AAJ0BBY4_9PEZI|nr:hypothetical protein QBC47DRAFT_322211 [Echria macrotheca]